MRAESVEIAMRRRRRPTHHLDNATNSHFGRGCSSQVLSLSSRGRYGVYNKKGTVLHISTLTLLAARIGYRFSSRIGNACLCTNEFARLNLCYRSFADGAITSMLPHAPPQSLVPVVFLHEVGHCLWFRIAVMRVVRVVRWANILHLVDTATFVASFIGPITRDLMRWSAPTV